MERWKRSKSKAVEISIVMNLFTLPRQYLLKYYVKAETLHGWSLFMPLEAKMGLGEEVTMGSQGQVVAMAFCILFQE